MVDRLLRLLLPQTLLPLPLPLPPPPQLPTRPRQPRELPVLVLLLILPMKTTRMKSRLDLVDCPSRRKLALGLELLLASLYSSVSRCASSGDDETSETTCHVETRQSPTQCLPAVPTTTRPIKDPSLRRMAMTLR